jgi:hypothetical protein
MPSSGSNTLFDFKDKMHLKKLQAKMCWENDSKAPVKGWVKFDKNISLWVNFVTKVSLFYFNLHVTRNLLIPMKAYFNKIICVTYILANKYFGFIFEIHLWTNLHNILDLDSYNPCLSISVPALQSFKIGGL